MLERSPEGELHVRSEYALSAAGVVAWWGGKPAEICQGNPLWGLPIRVRALESGERVVEIPGRYRAFWEADSLLWFLVEDRGQHQWVSLSPQGQLRAVPALEAPPRWGLRPCGVLSTGLRVFEANGELWLFDSLSGRWEHCAEQVFSVACVPERGEIAWLSRDGERVVVAVLSSERHPVRRAVLDSLPVAIGKVALVLDSLGVALCWLQEGRSGWELRWRRGGDERRVLSFRSQAEPLLQSLGQEWVLATGEELIIGNTTVRARGRAEKVSGLYFRRLPSGAILGAGGNVVWLWEVQPVPWWRWVLWLAGGLLGAGILLVGIALVGAKLWGELQRGIARRIARSGRGQLLDVPGAVRQADGLRSHGERVWREQRARLVEDQGRWWVLLPFSARFVQPGVLCWEVTEALEEHRSWLERVIMHELYRELGELRNDLERSHDAAALRRALERVERLWLQAEAARQLANPPTMSVVRIAELWERLRALFPELVERGVLICEPPIPSRLSVVGDVARLSAALGNIVRNAWEALQKAGTPEGACIRVRSYRTTERSSAKGAPSWVVVEVRDNGPGMPAGFRKGIGMRIVENVVETHKGEVRWESAESGGTCVRIWLPRNE